MEQVPVAALFLSCQLCAAWPAAPPSPALPLASTPSASGPWDANTAWPRPGPPGGGEGSRKAPSISVPAVTLLAEAEAKLRPRGGRPAGRWRGQAAFPVQASGPAHSPHPRSPCPFFRSFSFRKARCCNSAGRNWQGLLEGLNNTTTYFVYRGFL